MLPPPPPTPSSMLSVSKGIKVESLISSFEGKPLHEQKQLLGDQLFPLVKVIIVGVSFHVFFFSR